MFVFAFVKLFGNIILRLVVKVLVVLTNYALAENPTVFIFLWLFSVRLFLSHVSWTATAPEDESCSHCHLLVHPFPSMSSGVHPQPLSTPYPTSSFTLSLRCPTSTAPAPSLPCSLRGVLYCLHFPFLLFSLRNTCK